MGPRHLTWLLGLVACYSPDPPEGAPCQREEQCPRPQRCLAGRCRVAPQAGDAALPNDAPPNDAPRDAPLTCSQAGFSCVGGYSLNACSGLCFIRCNQAVTRTEAAARCAAWSGELAVFDSAAAVSCALTNNVPASWIGLTQTSGALSPAAGWSWNGGAALVFTAWNMAQPDDGDGVEDGAEQCGTATGAGWEDTGCTVTRGFICSR